MLFPASPHGNLPFLVVAVSLQFWVASANGLALASTKDDSQVFDSLREALNAGEYQSELPFEPIGKAGQRSGSSRRQVESGPIQLLMSVLAWIIIFVVAVLILVALVVSLWKLSIGQDTEEVAAATTTEVAVGRIASTSGEREVNYLDRAEKLAVEGCFQEAVHMLLLGAISHLSSTSRLQCRFSETSREVLRAYQAEPEQRRALEQLVRAVELSIFGGRPLSRRDFDSCQISLKTLLQGVGK